MSDPLEVLWERADLEEPIITGDEVEAWPPDWLARLKRASLVRQVESATWVTCDACDDGHTEEVTWIASPPGTPVRAYILCPSSGRVRVPLERLRQWRIDFDGLARVVAAGLSLAGSIEEVEARRLWALGKAAYARQSREVFLGRGLVWHDARNALGGARRFLASRNPIVLVPGEVPSGAAWPGEAPIVLPLKALLSCTDAGISVDRGHIDGLLAGRRPPPPAAAVDHFPTPAGATWEQVRIRFRDGHTVSVSVLGVERVLNFTQMGMASRKNAEPTVQWTLLKAFAEEGGTLTWRSSRADPKLKKRRELLAKDLRTFFGIDGDPIAATADGKGWRVRFELHDG